MGSCASTTTKSGAHRPASSPPPAVAKVICQDGKVEEFTPPVTAAAVSGPAAYLCWWESMYLDACAPEVAAEAELEAGEVYFVFPTSKSKQPLSLHDMCALAIKASSGLSLQDFHSSFRH